jgi:hypothetical protein
MLPSEGMPVPPQPLRMAARAKVPKRLRMAQANGGELRLRSAKSQE